MNKISLNCSEEGMKLIRMLSKMLPQELEILEQDIIDLPAPNPDSSTSTTALQNPTDADADDTTVVVSHQCSLPLREGILDGTIIQPVHPGNRTRQGTVTAHIDGACSGNGNVDARGSWGVHIRQGDQEIAAWNGRSAGNSELKATNNRMETAALLSTLRWATTTAVRSLQLRTDSRYVITGLEKIQSKGKGHDTNADLWKAVTEQVRIARHSGLEINWEWVKGHAGDTHNERADQLARAADGR